MGIHGQAPAPVKPARASDDEARRPMTPARAETVAIAKRYPFPRPGYSFLYVDGEALPLLSLGESLEESEVEFDGQSVKIETLLRPHGIAALAPLSRRTPVLAYGANAAPERLKRKFAPFGQAVFPVVNARLHGFDIVYAAHISSYGAVPATLAPSPGTVCDIAITCLDERELARMHETEFRRHTYLFGPLRNIRLEPDLLPVMDAVSTYVGGFGHIAPTGEALALAAIPAEGRRFRTCSQTEALREIQAMLGVPGSLDSFIQDAIDDDAIRRARTESLRAQAQPFSYRDFTATAP